MLDKILTILNGTLTKLALLTDKHAKAQAKQTDELKAAISSLASEVKAQKPPVVNVEPPKVEVSVPDVVIPKIEVPVVNVTVPEIKLPPINVPKPEVTVNVPDIKVPTPAVTVEAPEVTVNVPDQMEVKGFKDFAKSLLASLKAIATKSIHDDVDVLNPIPVLHVDENGKPVKLQGGAGGLSYFGGSTSPTEDGLGIPKHSERVLAYDGAGKLSSVTYKLGTTTVATLTLTRNGSGKITNVVRT